MKNDNAYKWKFRVWEKIHFSDLIEGRVLFSDLSKGSAHFPNLKNGRAPFFTKSLQNGLMGTLTEILPGIENLKKIY